MSKTIAATGGTSLGTLLTVVFIILKLTNVINWSWWWVLSPIWISFSLSILIIIGIIWFIHRFQK